MEILDSKTEENDKVLAGLKANLNHQNTVNSKIKNLTITSYESEISRLKKFTKPEKSTLELSQIPFRRMHQKQALEA